MAGLSTTDPSAVLREQEFALARHIRDPEVNPPPPGIEERRLKIYRELFYNNLEALLAGNFPVIRRLLGDDRWHGLVRAFFIAHRCRTPLFTEIGREFQRFLETRAAAEAGDPPFLPELAHYEWVELALQLEESEPAALPHDPHGDLLAGVPLRSPLAWPLGYRWPVQRLGPEFQPTEAPPAPTLLLVRRESDGRVRFSELSPLTFRLLERLDAFPELTGHAQLAALAAEAGAPDSAAFIAEGARMLAQLRDTGVLIGTRLKNEEPSA